MIYLNQAATSYPKPGCVADAFQQALAAPPAGQFRSTITAPGSSAEDSCRQSLGRLLEIAAWERICFSSGATESANLLIGGLPLAVGGKILVTATEHNAVLRVVYNHPRLAPLVQVVPCAADGTVPPALLRAAAAGAPCAAVFINHCSNVTGTVQDVAALCAAAHDLGALAVVDISQSAGCVPISVDGWGADAVFFTGHKGLLGVPGTGGYYLRPGLTLLPCKFGGTGQDSARLRYTEPPYEYEPGTQNLPGILALRAGVEYLLAEGVAAIHAREARQTAHLAAALRAMPGVTVYGPADRTAHGPVLSFTVKGLDPGDIAYILNAREVIVRVGLHCAPLIHSYIGSGEKGTVRVSLGYATTDAELTVFLDIMRELIQSL